MHRFPYKVLSHQLNEAWNWLQESDFTERWRLIWIEERDIFTSLWNLDGSGAAVYAPKPGFPIALSLFISSPLLSASPESSRCSSSSGACGPRSTSPPPVGRSSLAMNDPRWLCASIARTQEQGLWTYCCSSRYRADTSWRAGFIDERPYAGTRSVNPIGIPDDEDVKEPATVTTVQDMNGRSEERQTGTHQTSEEAYDQRDALDQSDGPSNRAFNPPFPHDHVGSPSAGSRKGTRLFHNGQDSVDQR